MSAHLPGHHETFREGAEEVKAKLRADLSRWTRARRAISLKPTLPCSECDSTGRTLCESCHGRGKQGIEFHGEQYACMTCEGTGHVTCVECAGTGSVVNVHRKKILWLIAIGAAAWLLVLLRLYMTERDILPGFRAEGGGQSTPGRVGPSGGGGVAPRGNPGSFAPPR